MKEIKILLWSTLILITVCLSGCQENGNNNLNQQPKNNNKFIGDWNLINSSSDNGTWSFYANKSAKNVQIQKDADQVITTISWFDYTNDTTTLCFSPKNQSVGSPNYFSECFLYKFTNNTDHLTLSYNGIMIMDLVKIS